MELKIKLSPPHMGGTEFEYIQKAFDENWIAPAGSNIIDFEKSLENYLGDNSYAVALNSGTAAIHLALKLAGVQKDDEVLCQSLTFAATAFPILYLGAKPVFVDSETETWNMCPKELEKAIRSRIVNGERPKAIIVVDLFGMPAKMNEIIAISKKYEIPLIEDAAEALGSEYNGQRCGTFGDFGIISFNGNKIITTSGGGALITKSKEEKEKAIFFATQAKDNFNWYEHSEIGYNYRMSNILAGIGIGQMKVLESHIQKRREINLFYQELFKPYSFITLYKEYSDVSKSNHWLSCIQINDNKKGKSPKGFKKYLENYCIECRFIWKPLHLQPVFKEFLYFGNHVSENIFNSGLCLPSGSNLNRQDKELISKVVLEYLDA